MEDMFAAAMDFCRKRQCDGLALLHRDADQQAIIVVLPPDEAADAFLEAYQLSSSTRYKKRKKYNDTAGETTICHLSARGRSAAEKNAAGVRSRTKLLDCPSKVPSRLLPSFDK